jgi:hypothetical protein
LIEFTLGSKAFQDTLKDMLETAWAIEGSDGGLKSFKEMALQGENPVEERRWLYEQAGYSDSYKDRQVKILEDLRQARMAIIMKSTREKTPD